MGRVVSIIAALGLFAIAAVAAAPWAVYSLALANIDGRPHLPSIERLSSSQEASLAASLHADVPLHVSKLSPWAYVLEVVRGPKEFSTGGAMAAWIVARNYNATHLKDRRMVWWHVSGASLVVWLTRNWTSDQVIARAFEIEQHEGPPSNGRH